MARVSVFTLINRSVSNMGAVNSKVKDLAIELIKLSYHEGINVQITSGYRSNAEQQRLYNQGRTTSGNIVTNAGPGQSVHNYGYAIDFVIVSEDGSRAIWVVNDKWRRVAALGKHLGFDWGGDWKSFPDNPHLDMGGLSWRQLKAGQRPHVPNVPKRDYYGIGDTGPRVTALQEYLNEVGIKCDVDGVYGEGTEAAVKAFQRKRGITADGFYGLGSLAEMNKALKELNNKEVTTASKPNKEVKPVEPEQRDFEAASKSLADNWKKAYDLGITDGHNPDGTPTRAQVASMIIEALELKE